MYDTVPYSQMVVINLISPVRISWLEFIFFFTLTNNIPLLESFKISICKRTSNVMANLFPGKKLFHNFNN